MGRWWGYLSYRTPMMMMRLSAAVLVLSVSFAAGCGGVPEEEPDLKGEITTIGRSVGSSAVQVLVEEHPGVHDGSGKAYVFVLDDRAVFAGTNDSHRRAGMDDLEAGVFVHVWFDGPVMDSYPLQGTARVVLIIPGPQPPP